jgi:hypothetical protein
MSDPLGGTVRPSEGNYQARPADSTSFRIRVIEVLERATLPPNHAAAVRLRQPGPEDHPPTPNHRS